MFCRSSRQRVFESLTRVSFSVASFEIARAWPNRNDRARFERKNGALQFWNFPFRRVRFSKSHRSRFDGASNSANSRAEAVHHPLRFILKYRRATNSRDMPDPNIDLAFMNGKMQANSLAWFQKASLAGVHEVSGAGTSKPVSRRWKITFALDRFLAVDNRNQGARNAFVIALSLSVFHSQIVRAIWISWKLFSSCLRG